MHGSELNIRHFLRETAESLVASIIEELYASLQIQRKFHLNGDVTFENHANTLTDELRIVTDMNFLSLEADRSCCSERLAARQS